MLRESIMIGIAPPQWAASPHVSVINIDCSLQTHQNEQWLLGFLRTIDMESRCWQHVVATELKDPICHSNECQIGSFSSAATMCISHIIFSHFHPSTQPYTMWANFYDHYFWHCHTLAHACGAWMVSRGGGGGGRKWTFTSCHLG